MIPAKLLHYDILAKIGEGGMGVVYKARDRHLDRFVAIKVLNPRWISDPDRRRRFAQEAKAASALNHPNIVTIHDISTDHDVDFIAMEYVEGHTLDHHIGRRGMSPSMALDCAIQTAGALAKAHAAGIVHRDLKPSNIMVTDGGVVKILDFGVAKLIAVDRAAAVADPAGVTHTMTERGQPRTAEGRIVGTAAYMSPEQAAGQPVDARSDIFSFGTLLYEMTTGVRAFAGTSTVDTLAALLNSDPKPPSQLSKDVGRDLERIILRCLRKDPAKRFQATADLVVDLEEIKAATEAAATVSGRPRSFQRTLVISGIVATVAGTGLAAGAMWLSRTSRNRLPPPTIDRLTSYPGNETSASLSPDGGHVAFSWNGVNEDNLDIYIKPVGGEASLRLTTDPPRMACRHGRRMAARSRSCAIRGTSSPFT